MRSGTYAGLVCTTEIPKDGAAFYSYFCVEYAFHERSVSIVCSSVSALLYSMGAEWAVGRTGDFGDVLQQQGVLGEPLHLHGDDIFELEPATQLVTLSLLWKQSSGLGHTQTHTTH